MSILSFKRLKKQREEWTGGLLLIDEIDATLHPAAQKRLIDLLVKEAKINNIRTYLSIFVIRLRIIMTVRIMTLNCIILQMEIDV